MMDVDVERGLALQLHALHETDIAWILDRIDSDARLRMLTLLNELKSLGVQPTSDLLNEVRAVVSTDRTRDNMAVGAIDIIDAASANTIYRFLDREAPVVKRCVTEFRQWRWLPQIQTYASAISPGISARVDPVAGRKHPSTKVRLALLNALANEIQKNTAIAEADAVVHTSAIRPSFMSKWPAFATRVMTWLH